METNEIKLLRCIKIITALIIEITKTVPMVGFVMNDEIDDVFIQVNKIINEVLEDMSIKEE